MLIGKTDLGKFPVILAPLEDITDSAFRNICRMHGADMVYTEFVSSEALVRSAVKSSNKMLFDETEKPLGIQIFGNDVEAMKNAALLAEELNPDLIDINFGCPVRKVAMKGAGAGLLNDIPLMIAITREVVRAVKLPVTVKTRLGWDENSKVIVDVAEQLEDVGVQAITIHGRTRAQMYSGEADWTLIGDVKNNPRMKIPVIGNGDITSALKAAEMFDKYGVDAIMIGRAAIGNPWIFNEIKAFVHNGELNPPPDLQERITVSLAHLRLAIQKKGERKGIIEMRKHYAGYFKGLPGFKKVRMDMLTRQNFDEIEGILQNLLCL
ncbi:MAG: tRNA dihydrouridine synthase DusB [Bacteroidales bacterium]|nr:tRNA dihydrouridine synthase DusB [Bacteroidales bacterium]